MQLELHEAHLKVKLPQVLVGESRRPLLGMFNLETPLTENSLMSTPEACLRNQREIFVKPFFL